MTHSEILVRLGTIKEKGSRALQLLESRPLSPIDQAEILSLVQWIKTELESEYRRVMPERMQRAMTIFERTVYSPTIEETWKKTGISRLKVDGTPDGKWREPLEAVIYHAGKYLARSG